MKSYLIINKIIAGVILAIFLYAAFYNPSKNNFPIKCVHQELLGARCPTCGMSHAFSAIIRLQFAKALDFQPNSISVFCFFLIQLIMRIVAIRIVTKSYFSYNNIINIDIVLSLLLFLYLFRHLIFATFYIFYKTLLTGIG